VTLPGVMSYAGFGIRFGAKFLDGIIVGVPAMALQYVIAQQMGLPMFTAPLWARTGVGMVLGGSYYTFFVGKFGATPGKMAAKLLIVNPDGSKVSYAKALGRFFSSEYVSGILTLCIGYLIMIWDPEKRTLHDRICSTRVIRK
jgi:uncharacterized RDD family membrane protein YckC